MDRKELERHLSNSVMMQIDRDVLLYALLTENKSALAELRGVVDEQESINKTYLDAFDAAVDEHEKKAVVCCVRMSEPVRHEEVAAKASDFRTGKIKV